MLGKPGMSASMGARHHPACCRPALAQSDATLQSARRSLTRSSRRFKGERPTPGEPGTRSAPADARWQPMRDLSGRLPLLPSLITTITTWRETGICEVRGGASTVPRGAGRNRPDGDGRYRRVSS